MEKTVSEIIEAEIINSSWYYAWLPTTTQKYE
jgi:hypothetical protein